MAKKVLRLAYFGIGVLYVLAGLSALLGGAH